MSLFALFDASGPVGSGLAAALWAAFIPCRAAMLFSRLSVRSD